MLYNCCDLFGKPYFFSQEPTLTEPFKKVRKPLKKPTQFVLSEKSDRKCWSYLLLLGRCDTQTSLVTQNPNRSCTVTTRPRAAHLLLQQDHLTSFLQDRPNHKTNHNTLLKMSDITLKSYPTLPYVLTAL